MKDANADGRPGIETPRTEPPSGPLASLFERLQDGRAVVGVIGLGYVGLPLSRVFAGAGARVIGFDIDGEKVRRLTLGQSYIATIPAEDVARMRVDDRFTATSDFTRLGEPDAVVICVPTPLNAHREPDLQYIEQTAAAIARTLRPGQLVVLESTTYPGTTREVVLPVLERTGLRLDQDFLLAFSPEREDPGRRTHTTDTIPKLVGGCSACSTQAARQLYARAIRTVVDVSSAEIAEAAKILENVYRAVNIALVNELKVVFDRMGIDVWQVIDAAATKPFGFARFTPGPGLGGHCIPIDPFYLTWKARQYDVHTRFIELAGEINTAMPEYVVQRTMLALNEDGRALRGSRLLVLGLAYKKDVDDPRESPSNVIIERLEALGATVDYSDPHIPRSPQQRRHRLGKTSVELGPQTLARYDAALLLTDHSAFDYAMIHAHSRLIIDTRNAFASLSGGQGARVVKA